MTTTRQRLPSRRPSVTDNTRWPIDGGRRIHVTAGFGPDGRILETFLRGGGRVGSETDFLLDDIAVLVSRALQHGDRIEAIAAGVGRGPDGEPQSVVGAVIDALRRIERDVQQAEVGGEIPNTSHGTPPTVVTASAPEIDQQERVITRTEGKST